MTKFFAAMFAVAALTFTACEPKGPDGPIVGGNDSTEVEDLVIPQVAAPEAGKTTVVLYVPEDTPAGCYAVGTFDWNDKNTEKMFTAVEGAVNERWVSYTFDWTEGLAFKVLAIPSDPAVAPGWSYQWGKNIDPENDLTEDNVVILDGSMGGVLELENQGQPKLGGLVDGGVCYIHVKAWATTPVIKPVPCETAAFKHPWNGGNWEYRDAVKTAEATFELNALYGNTGINVATNVNGDGENWYPADQIEFVGDVAQGDSVNIKFVSEKLCIGKVTVTLIEKGQVSDEPVELKDITVKAKMPAGVEGPISAWVWPNGGEGSWVTPEKVGDWYVYSAKQVEAVNIIYIEGTSWDDKKWQTADLKATENTCWQIGADYVATSIDCE